MERIADKWFEAGEMAAGVIRIRETCLDPGAACNIWLIRGRATDLVFDSGTGLISLKKSLPELFRRPVICVSSHSHFDHIGGSYEFEERWMHPAEAGIITKPNRVNTTVEGFLTSDLFSALPFEGFRPELYRVKPAPPTGFLQDGRIIDLGGRTLEVLHLAGHSPGSIGLYESSTRSLFSGDALFDGPLHDDVFHSDIPAWLKTMERLLKLPVGLVHGGHFKSFGSTRMKELVNSYIDSKNK